MFSWCVLLRKILFIHYFYNQILPLELLRDLMVALLGNQMTVMHACAFFLCPSFLSLKTDFWWILRDFFIHSCSLSRLGLKVKPKKYTRLVEVKMRLG